MGIRVTTDPSETKFQFPGEPGLDELYEAETNRRYANARFWGGFTLLAYVLVVLFIGWLAGWDAHDTVRTILFAIGGAMFGRMLDKMQAQRIYRRCRDAWVKAAENDPEWKP